VEEAKIIEQVEEVKRDEKYEIELKIERRKQRGSDDTLL